MIAFRLPTSLAAACRAMTVTYEPSMSDGPRGAPAGEIEILLSGERGAFQVRYRTRDGAPRCVEVSAPFVSIVPANQAFELECRAPADLLTVSLREDFVRSHAREDGDAPVLRERFVTVDPFLRRVGNTLLSGFRVQRPPTPDYLESVADAIADHITYQYAGAPAGREGNGLAPHRVERVKTLIAQRLADPLQVEQLAEAICMSPFHFARMFKQSTGESPHSYITRVRMEEAKRLLRDTDAPLSEIARRVGYRTQAHFTGVFHERAGVTPRAYRVRNRGGAG